MSPFHLVVVLRGKRPAGSVCFWVRKAPTSLALTQIFGGAIPVLATCHGDLSAPNLRNFRSLSPLTLGGTSRVLLFYYSFIFRHFYGGNYGKHCGGEGGGFLEESTKGPILFFITLSNVR